MTRRRQAGARWTAQQWNQLNIICPVSWNRPSSHGLTITVSGRSSMPSASKTCCADEGQPLPAPARRQSGALAAWSPAALAEAESPGPADPAFVGYAACHWCHVMAHESFENDDVAARHEPALRQYQGRSRGAARHRPDLHGGAACDGRAGRLAADHVPDPRWQAVLGRHLFSAASRAMAARASSR